MDDTSIASLKTAFDATMATARAFMESRAILTAVELDLFTAVSEGSSATSVAQRIGTDPRATEMLMNVLVTQGLLRKTGNSYALTPVAEKFLTSTSADSARAAIMHTVGLWNSWSTLTAAMRAGTSVVKRRRNTEETEAFIAAMHRNSIERASVVARALGIARYRNMLDVGGGSGGYSITFARTNPVLKSVVFDLGPVTRIARRHILDAGVADRVSVTQGNFHSDPFGNGFDLVFLSAICHMNGPDENRSLFRKAFAALQPGGDLVIHDHILNADKTAPKAGVLFALNMLVNTAAGNSYSEEEYHAWLDEAGFSGIRSVPLPGATGLVVGTR